MSEQAFPSRRDVQMGLASRRDDIPGMTLRDWFAGQAAVGGLANPNRKGAFDGAAFARACYECADAMLAERERNNP